MSWLRGAWREVYGLFVDDALLAVAVLAWLALASLALPRFGIGRDWGGVVLFVGLAAVLVDSAWRRARR